MKTQVPQIIIMSSGAVLLLIGVALVIYQMSQMDFATATPSTRSIETTPSGGMKLSTTYVGLVITAIGAMLEIVGYVAALPWRRNREGNSN